MPRPKYTLLGDATPGFVSRANEMIEELYELLSQLNPHDLLSTVHGDTRVDPEQDDVQRGDIIVGQHTPQGGDVIRWQRFAIGDAATVLKTTDGIDLVYGKVVLTAGATQEVTGTLPILNGGTGNTAYTAGSIIFAGAGTPPTQLTQDNANLFWDDSNNRLGVGTATPEKQVELAQTGVGTTVAVEALRIANRTAATSGSTRQFSPALEFVAQGWDTDGGGANRVCRAAIYNRVVSGSAPSAYLAIVFDNATGGYVTDDIYLGRAVDGGAPDLRFRDGNIIFANNGARGISYATNPLTDNMSSNQAIVGYSDGTIELTTVGSFVRLLGNTAGLTTLPMLDIRGFNVAAGATPIPHIRFRATPAGAVSAGFGTQLLFQATSTTTADQDQTAIDSVWGVATHASRSGDIVFEHVDAAVALAEKFRFKSTGELLLIAAGIVTFTGRSKITSPADSQVLLTDNAGTAFARLMLGGTSSSFPAIKRSSAALHVRLADDSAFAELQCGALTINAQTGNVAGTTYTPVRSAEANLDANVTMFEAQYAQVGNTVTVSGRFTADPTTTLTATSFEMTLPVASNIGAVEDLAGVAFSGAIAGQGAQISGSVANNTAVVTWVAADVTSQSWSFIFSYQVI